MKIFKFPSFRMPYEVTIRDRTRVSSLTSVRFYGDDKLVVCDFNDKATYLVRMASHGGLDLLDHKNTVIRGSTPVQTDLMDINKNVFAVTNFFQGSISIYKIDACKINFIKEINLNSFIYVHGVRFVPEHDNLIWVSYCGADNRCVQIIDYIKEKIIHTIPLKEQAQDCAFLQQGGRQYAVQVARTPHISEGRLSEGAPLKKMYATIYLLEIPDDINLNPPKIVSEARFDGHLDAAKEYNGAVYCANQYMDRIDIFTLNGTNILRTGAIPGFNFPHGLDIRNDGVLAVTNYGDCSLRIGRLGVVPPKISRDFE